MSSKTIDSDATKKDLNTLSPLRLVGEARPEGLGAGHLGVVLARAGVGKTTFLVQVGLDLLLKGKSVLHVSVAQTVEHVQSRYDALVDDILDSLPAAERGALKLDISKRRMISAFADQKLWLGRIEETAEVMRERLDFRPDVIIIDGYDWEQSSLICTAAILGGAKAYCKLRNIELWVTGQTHREVTGSKPEAIPEPCQKFDSLIDVALFLDPEPDHVDVHLLKGGELKNQYKLDPDTLRIVGSDKKGGKKAGGLPASAFTLLSGGNKGAEAEFGTLAVEYGVAEQNFTFEGRKAERAVNQVVLSESELRQGAVSEVYLQAHMKRSYPDTELFRKTLQTIWHQVKTAGEVFVIGLVQDDNTVRGGTGWAAELARHWHKPVHVYDQEKKAWFVWNEDKWEKTDSPKISSRRFCGTGTRFLSDDGKKAIQQLFKNSFSK